MRRAGRGTRWPSTEFMRAPGRFPWGSDGVVVKRIERGMPAEFRDLQTPGGELAPSVFTTEGDVENLLESLRGREPFMFELRRSDGWMLTVGLGPNRGVVQHSSSDGLPPYLVTVNEEEFGDELFVDFMIADTPASIPARFCVPLDAIRRVITEFVLTGSRSSAVVWEEIQGG